MVLIFSKNDSPRLRYALKIFFTELLGISWRLVQSKDDIPGGDIPLINYSDVDIPGSFKIQPSGLLFEKGVREINPKVFIWSGIPVFFGNNQNSDLPFDPLAVVFYLVSRYEEYHKNERDSHDRFIPAASLAYQYDFLDLPLANVIADKVGNMLNDQFQGIRIQFPGYTFIPTVDVDIAFAHHGKGFLRAAGGLAKLLLKARFADIKERIRVNTGKMQDPYDNFEFQLKTFNNQGIKPTYFILLGDYGPYDKNISYRNKKFRELILRLSKDAGIGIHPSYRSYEEPGRLELEIRRLSEITGKEIVLSRQHFLRMKFPETFRNLQQCGIKKDFSMGYASVNGFRAGISIPYPFYDLLEEEEKDLMIYPFMFMDTAMQDYMGVSPKDYISFVKPLFKRINYYGGSLTGVWHNYALSNDKKKHKAFRTIIKECSK